MLVLAHVKKADIESVEEQRRQGKGDGRKGKGDGRDSGGKR